MKLIKKLLIIAIISIIIIVNSAINVYADFSCSIKMDADKKIAQSGDTIVINVVLNDISLSEGAKGITAFDGYLEYDSSVFEDLKKSNFDAGENRTVTYTESTNRVYVEIDDANGIISESGTIIFTIVMKVKDSVNYTSTTVSLNNVSITDNSGSKKCSSSITFYSSEQASIIDSIVDSEVTTEETEEIISTDIETEENIISTTNTKTEENTKNNKNNNSEIIVIIIGSVAVIAGIIALVKINAKKAV